jgi:hypothetical protein
MISPTQTTPGAAQTSTTTASRAAPTSTPLPAAADPGVDPALDHAVQAVLAIVSAGIGCAAVVAVAVVMYSPHRSGIVRHIPITV